MEIFLFLRGFVVHRVCGMVRKKEIRYIKSLLVTGEREHGFYIPIAHKTLPNNVIYCSVFVIFVVEGVCISRP